MLNASPLKTCSLVSPLSPDGPVGDFCKPVLEIRDGFAGQCDNGLAAGSLPNLIAEEIKAPGCPADKRLVWMLLKLQFTENPVQRSNGPAQLVTAGSNDSNVVHVTGIEYRLSVCDVSA